MFTVRLFTAALLASLANSQSTDATLTGTVTDPAGALLVNAAVTAHNARTGVATQTRTNGSGVYLFPALQPGLYRVRSEHPGFRAIVFNDVVLEVGARININIEMEVGAVVETVEVVATDETTLGFITSSVGGLVT
ncbi:MAG: carboxypeptidase-like regulatory domain-containing protein, partial [Bryobacteraceae bacterium]